MNMKANIFSKLILLMILVLGFGNAKAQNLDIKLGDYERNNKYHYVLSEKQLEGLGSISTESDEWKVVSFTVSSTVKGFVLIEESTSDVITQKQHRIFNDVPSGDTIYIENIKLANIATGVVQDGGSVVIIKAVDVKIKLGDYAPNEEGHYVLREKQLERLNSISSESDEWKVVSFTVCVIVKGFVQIDKSTSDVITQQQHQIFNACPSGCKIYITDIKLANSATGVVKDGMTVVIKKK
jgi:hypothetical protein